MDSSKDRQKKADEWEPSGPHRVLRVVAWFVVFLMLMTLSFPPERTPDPAINQKITIDLSKRPCTKETMGTPGNSRTVWVCELRPGDPGEPPLGKP